MKICVIILICLFVFNFGTDANTSTAQLSHQLTTGNVEEMNKAVKKIILLRKDGIPILINALSISLKNIYTLNNYARSNICIKALYDLAKDQIYIEDEIPILILTLKKQSFIKDTYLTAEILRLISGLDVGYSEEFINEYSSEIESDRLKKIEIWEKWYKSK